MASITCSHARSVASAQFKNSQTPNRAKTFKPKYTNGLKNSRRKKHHGKAGTSDVLRSDSFDKETSKTLKIKGGGKCYTFLNCTSIISQKPVQGYKLLHLPSFQTLF